MQTPQRLVDAKGHNDSWYNKGCCGWFMQTPQRLVDAKGHNDSWYNKGCCGWFMQTPQRLDDVKGHNEWLIQQWTLLDTLCMKTTQRLDDTKGQNEWLIKLRTQWMVYGNTTETGWCLEKIQWIVFNNEGHSGWFVLKNTMYKRHRGIVDANNTETGWCQMTQWLVDSSWLMQKQIGWWLRLQWLVDNERHGDMFLHLMQWLVDDQGCFCGLMTKEAKDALTDRWQNTMTNLYSIQYQGHILYTGLLPSI